MFGCLSGSLLAGQDSLNTIGNSWTRGSFWLVCHYIWVFITLITVSPISTFWGSIFLSSFIIVLWLPQSLLHLHSYLKCQWLDLITHASNLHVYTLWGRLLVLNVKCWWEACQVWEPKLSFAFFRKDIRLEFFIIHSYDSDIEQNAQRMPFLQVWCGRSFSSFMTSVPETN